MLILYTGIAVIMASTYLLTSRTFIRQTIPGYLHLKPDEWRRERHKNRFLETVEMWAFQVANIQGLLQERNLLHLILGLVKEIPLIDSLSDLYFRNDSLLRRCFAVAI